MSETIRLYNDDYTELLFTTDDRAVAHKFFTDSGKDSMSLVIDFGEGWKQRWGGKLVLQDNGCISYVGGSEFLPYMIQWPNPSLT